jgi:hypothetical protein
VIVAPSGARIRSSPDATDPSNILAALSPGSLVEVLSATGDWLRVRSSTQSGSREGFILHTLVDDAASHKMQESVGTTMVWTGSGPGSGTDFEKWASAATESPFPAVTAKTVMNCWEAILLAAFRAGDITWSWIHHLYTAVNVAQWVTAMSKGSLVTYAGSGQGAKMPQRGDLVFFEGIAHVALATGNGSEIYTFWPPPNTPFTLGGTTDKVKISTIDDLSAWWQQNMHSSPTIQFGAPAW